MHLMALKERHPEKFLDYSMAQDLISRGPDLRELFIDV